jgi:pimeloyl-ACP methyl ester carboxylesterase
MQWQALQRIGEYLGQTGRFDSLQQAADALWADSTTFGSHTPDQWLALSRHMVKPLAGAPGSLTLHYDPAIALPFRDVTAESVAQGEAMLWALYDNIKAKTLLTRGAVSDLLSVATAQAMTQRGPRAQLLEFAGVGHAPTFVAASQVQPVVSFLLHP